VSKKKVSGKTSKKKSTKKERALIPITWLYRYGWNQGHIETALRDGLPVYDPNDPNHKKLSVDFSTVRTKKDKSEEEIYRKLCKDRLKLLAAWEAVPAGSGGGHPCPTKKDR
jgi:hypothetical protein